jgi:glycosyltransferase involved in cell wall biosynthesis
MPEIEKPKILIVQRRLTHYRLPFFDALRQQLSERGYSLQLAFGTPTRTEIDKGDSGHIPWGTCLNTSYFMGGKLCWQPFGKLLEGASMVVVAAENKLLYNLLVQMLRRDLRVALWGHGGNLQGNPYSWRERFKRVAARQADWWFGYTEMSVPLIERSGFPRNRITVVNNSIDTAELAAQRFAVKSEILVRIKQKLGLDGRCIGIFVGSLYPEKRIGFMLDAATEIRQRVPHFEFLIIGDGVQKELIKQFCAANCWAHYLGMQKGQDKVNAIALSRVMINPGAVGLGILDAFVCGVPIITTRCGMHGPEIAYLVSGQNGLMTSNILEDYISAAVALLQDDIQLDRLKEGCGESALRYTVENMARNFADGVQHCLTAPLYR